MTIGSYLLALATVAAVLSMIGYFLVARGKKEYLLTAKWLYYLMTGLVIIAVFYLTALFLNNRFEFSYISSYSSIDLAANYKITSLWAGQEGSFLLWVAFGVLLGLWVKAKAKEDAGWVMFFYLVGQLFLFTLLNISSPFKLNSIVPVDGQGLNPLLQNFWMQIHPPIVFLGYAAVFVPFAFAMAALASNKYDNWAKLTYPWAVFSVFTLGTGIFLGSYWAYETLGWGGFWGWDPVENASLIPWLGSIALVHGMILESRKGSFKKTNLFLAITTFLMVIYGTFLTRSGVLADFSVHSFVDLGLNAYLAVFLIGFTVVSYGLLAIRAKSIKSAEPAKSPMTREFTVFLGMLFLILSAFLVLLGTSSPLLTRVFKEPSAVDISFYTLTNLPIAIIIGIILGLTALFSWSITSWAMIKRNMLISVAASLIITLISVLSGVKDLIHLLFIFTSGFAFTANLVLFINRCRLGFYRILADLIHIGLALMFIGIVISAGYSSGEKFSLILNETNESLGYNFTFSGMDIISAKKETVDILVERGGDKFTARPVFVYSSHGIVRNPYIKKMLFYDLYISPEEIKFIPAEEAGQSLIMKRGQTAEIEGHHITFLNFEQGAHDREGMIAVGAELEIHTADGKTETIVPLYVVTEKTTEHIATKIPGTDLNVFLLKISADEGMIMLGITQNDNPDEFEEKPVLIMEVTKKPLINFVWLGLILIMFGSGFAAYKRIRDV